MNDSPQTLENTVIEVSADDIVSAGNAALPVDSPKRKARPPVLFGHSGELQQLSVGAWSLVQEGIPENTRDAYRAALKKYERWCRATRRPTVEEAPSSPAALVEYLTYLLRTPLEATGKPTAPSSVGVFLAAVRHRHRAKLDVDPRWSVPESLTLTKAYLGYSRLWLKMGHRPGRTVPTSWEELRAYAASAEAYGSLSARRNIALVLLSFWMCARASEMSSLRISRGDDNIRFRRDGVELYVPLSKTKDNYWVGVPAYPQEPELCAVTALSRYMEDLRAVGRDEGPLFAPFVRGHGDRFAHGLTALDPRSISYVTFSWARRLGLGRRSAHSHRAGAATEAAARGVHVEQIAEMGRWTDLNIVRKHYIDSSVYRHPLAP